jgi:hypothetical protein
MENGKMLSTSSKLPLLCLVNDIRIFKYRCQFEARVNLFVGCAYFGQKIKTKPIDQSAVHLVRYASAELARSGLAP